MSADQKSDLIMHRASLQGLRPTNEDSELCKINLSIKGHSIDKVSSPVDVFVICDGHGGSEVAKYVTPYLEKILTGPKMTYPVSQDYIYKIYNHIQQKIINHPKNIGMGCGCTALVVIRYMLYSKRHLQVINIGDCRAVLSRRNLAIPLCLDHKPDWPDEKIRIDNVNKIHKQNERIYFGEGAWRIGDLSVSRSFGDLDNTPYVTHIPDVFHYPMEYADDFMIMACDGLWDVLGNEEAINFVRDHILNNHVYTYNIPHLYPSHHNDGSNNIAKKIAEYAIARGSTDNISVIIVIFRKNNI